MSSLLIIGAKGFAKELMEAVLQAVPNRPLFFFDDVSDDIGDELFGKYPVIRTDEAARQLFIESDASFALGVGEPRLRRMLSNRFLELGGRPETVISPFAKIGRFDNQIGPGACILTDAIVETANQIGEGVLLHVGSFVSHDVQIGDYCEVSPRANLLGGVSVGHECRIGTNATILPRVRLGNNVVVGAGAVVTKDIEDGKTVIGMPARSTA